MNKQPNMTNLENTRKFMNLIFNSIVRTLVSALNSILAMMIAQKNHDVRKNKIFKIFKIQTKTHPCITNLGPSKCCLKRIYGDMRPR